MFYNQQTHRERERLTAWEIINRYFSPAGLNRGEEDTVRFFLLDLEKITGREWRPGNCTAVPALVGSAGSIYIRSLWKDYPTMFTKPEPKRYLHLHFFLSSKLNRTGESLILDPTGVPTEWGNDNSIKPYFGLREAAAGNHHRVYEQMEELDDWGVRDLPPGFHP